MPGDGVGGRAAEREVVRDRVDGGRDARDLERHVERRRAGRRRRDRDDAGGRGRGVRRVEVDLAGEIGRGERGRRGAARVRVPVDREGEDVACDRIGHRDGLRRGRVGVDRRGRGERDARPRSRSPLATRWMIVITPAFSKKAKPVGSAVASAFLRASATSCGLAPARTSTLAPPIGPAAVRQRDRPVAGLVRGRDRDRARRVARRVDRATCRRTSSSTLDVNEAAREMTSVRPSDAIETVYAPPIWSRSATRSSCECSPGRPCGTARCCRCRRCRRA